MTYWVDQGRRWTRTWCFRFFIFQMDLCVVLVAGRLEVFFTISSLSGDATQNYELCEKQVFVGHHCVCSSDKSLKKIERGMTFLLLRVNKLVRNLVRGILWAQDKAYSSQSITQKALDFHHFP